LFHAFRRSLTAFALVFVAALASSARASIEHPDPRAEALYESAMKRLERPTIEPVRLAKSEHVAFEWLPIDAAIARVTSWTNRVALENLEHWAAR